MKIFDYKPLKELLVEQELGLLADSLDQLLAEGLSEKRYGDIPRWRAAVQALPEIDRVRFQADRAAVSLVSDQVPDQGKLKAALMGLHPWRKGPFDFFGTEIDTEWRSDKKWDRLKNEIEPLTGRRVLDVGCGSGYHCWRMFAAGAEFVLGIDPTPLFIYQYWAMQRYARQHAVWVVPARLEHMPRPLQAFDTVFSMGVLYHRRSPFDHLQELKDALAPGGQLVLETLVVEGGAGQVLVPEGRYSKMGNVWFLPSVPELCNWLKKMNFSQVSVVDVSRTEVDEQRSTDWMQFHSLSDFLDPSDASLTIEGYPAPTRAIVLATVS